MNKEEDLRDPDDTNTYELWGTEFVRLAFDAEGRDVAVNSIRYAGPSWPPPRTIDVSGRRWKRISYSHLDGPPMSRVARGALYQFQEVL